MRANVRFEHQLLAAESEHTVNGMLELQAPPAPEGPPARPFVEELGRSAGEGPS